MATAIMKIAALSDHFHSSEAKSCPNRSKETGEKFFSTFIEPLGRRQFLLQPGNLSRLRVFLLRFQDWVCLNPR